LTIKTFSIVLFEAFEVKIGYISSLIIVISICFAYFSATQFMKCENCEHFFVVVPDAEQMIPKELETGRSKTLLLTPAKVKRTLIIINYLIILI